MNRAMLFVLSLLITSTAYGQKPDWPGVSELVLQGLEQPDLSKLNHGFNRCVALYMGLSRILQVDTPDLALDMDKQGALLLQASQLSSIKIALDRDNITFDPVQLTDRNNKAIITFFDMYNKWFDSNYISKGSYFESDPEAKLEIDSCHGLSSYAQGFIEETTAAIKEYADNLSLVN